MDFRCLHKYLDTKFVVNGWHKSQVFDVERLSSRMLRSGQTAKAYDKEAAGSNAFIYEVLVDHDLHRLVWALSEVA